MRRKMQQADIARALGISRQRVHALKARGMPVDSIEAARQWRAEHLDADAMKPDPRGRAAVADPDEHRRERTALVAARRRLAELELAEREGRLIDAAAATAQAHRAGLTIRDAWLAQAAKLAPDLAAMADPIAIERFLLSAFRSELARLADSVDGPMRGNGAAHPDE